MPIVQSRRGAALLASVVLGLSACGMGPQSMGPQPRDDRTVAITVRVIDEQGRPIPGALVTVGEEEQRTDADGIMQLSIAGPVVANVSMPNMLVEPVAIGPDDADGELIVRLWDRVGVDGATRSSLHFGGDVMLGRRYLQEDLSTPFIDDAASARAVVGDLAPLSAAADFTVVNLETVVGELPDEHALAAKRFLLQSTPLVTETLDEMGADLVTLGNNHAYDWGEEGILSTLEVLDEAGIAHVGAGTSRGDATRGTIVDLDGMQIGVVSSTTVNGSFVNDQLPAADALVPEDLPAEESWQYEQRLFSYRSTEGRQLISSDERRIGEVWSLFESLEDDLGEEEAARLWAAMVVEYPELQDWVARRGHGGAAPYRRMEMEAEITRLRNEGADFVVVQIHGGYQFAEVNSATLERISHDAIDAGADAVVSHHPHVLQGVEWYAGKLIVYSLGNLLFDQGFLATFPGAILRLVTDGNEIIDARFLPIVLDRYRPVPVTGVAAQQIVGMIDARSVLPATSSRVNGLSIGSVLDAPDVVNAPTLVVFERNSGLISTSRSTTDVSVVTEAGIPQEMPTCALVRTDRLSEDVEVGVDLFGWGRFDDDTADGRSRAPLNWIAPSDAERWQFVTGASGDRFDDALELFADKDSDDFRTDRRTHRCRPASPLRR